MRDKKRSEGEEEEGQDGGLLEKQDSLSECLNVDGSIRPCLPQLLKAKEPSDELVSKS